MYIYLYNETYYKKSHIPYYKDHTIMVDNKPHDLLFASWKPGEPIA